MTSSWFFLSTLNYDALSTTHQIKGVQFHQNPSDCSGPISCQRTGVTKVADFLLRRLSSCGPLHDGGQQAQNWFFSFQNRCRPVWSRRFTSHSPCIAAAQSVTSTLHFTLIVAVKGQASLQVLGDPCTNPVFIFPCGQIPPSIIIAFYRRLILRHAHDGLQTQNP